MNPTQVPLPLPRTTGPLSLETAFSQRRSIRDYRDESLALAEISQILWAAQGITSPEGFRNAPSAGAIYPYATYLVVGKVEALTPGVFRYQPREHALMPVVAGDVRVELGRAAMNQACVSTAAAIVAIAGNESSIAVKYGPDRALMYFHLEGGHIGQNVHLQAVALGIGSVAVAAFDDATVQRLLHLPVEERPVYLFPFGRPAKEIA